MAKNAPQLRIRPNLRSSSPDGDRARGKSHRVNEDGTGTIEFGEKQMIIMPYWFGVMYDQISVNDESHVNDREAEGMVTLHETWRMSVEVEEDGYANFAIHPFGEHVLCYSLGSHSVSVWDLQSQSLLWDFTHEECSLNNGTFSHDGRFVAVYSMRQEDLWIFDSTTGEHIRRQKLNGPAGNDCHACVFGPEDNTLILCFCGAVVCLSPEDGIPRWSETPDQECCSACLFLTANRGVAYLTADDRIRIRNVDTGKRDCDLGVAVQNFRLSTDLATAASLRSDGRTEIIDLQSGQCTRMLPTVFPKESSLAWCSQRHLLVGEHVDGNALVICDDCSGETLCEYFIGADEVWQIEFHPNDDRMLICGFDDGTVRAFSVDD